MTKAILTLVILVLPHLVGAQDVVGFPFGNVTKKDFAIDKYPDDTSAAAYVIAEFGEAHVPYDNPNRIIFRYHTRIRILKQNALSKADIQIPLYKQNDKEEIIYSISASSFNENGGTIKETKADRKSVFTEKNGRFYNVSKFAIPNVQVGSVIEYQYEMETPFLFNFKDWEFQSDIPKIQSEYHTTIPANYLYNVTLRGYLKLASHESSIVHECLRSGAGGTADCSVNKYRMLNIPAFKEEEFMVAKSNFMSAINFELAEVHHWDGRKDKYTKEWKDADLELKTDSDFGMQLRRGKDVVDGYIDAATLGETDPLTKAKKIYDFIKYHYRWDGLYGYRSEFGIKKAFDEKKGNIGDINLTLIAALRYAGFNADPVLLATRSLSRPIEVHPVLSNFNYVVAKLTLGDKTYLLDAVDDFLPFGSIPLSCYNGIGRVITADGSSWMDIKPTDRDRTITLIKLKLGSNGMMTGTINETSYGYAALRKRKELADYDDQKSYLEKRQSKDHFMTISSYERNGEDDLSKPLNEVFGVEFAAFDSPETTSFLFNPFLSGRNESNPFKSDYRTYPVDFAVPQDQNVTIMIELPENFEVASMPDKVGVSLPNSGGRYMFGAMVTGQVLTVNNILSLSRPQYGPEEYPYLKEVYGRMVQAQNTDIIFKKK